MSNSYLNKCLITVSVMGLLITVSSQLEAAEGYRLDRLWPTYDDNSGIVAHKQNYLLYTYTDTPNLAPTSPNRVYPPPVYQYNPQEVKFQLSMKTQYPHPYWLGDKNSIWLAYTQQSHLQFANSENSRPFRENNYIFEPFVFSHQFEKWQTDGYWNPRVINFGYVHESNGLVRPYSRSWNRFYVQFGVEKRIGKFGNIALMLRPWARYPLNNTGGGDNPDISDYLGNGDLELLYWSRRYFLSVLARSRSLQADWSMALSSDKYSDKSLHFHVQFFTGYGESLIDYNQKHSTIGIGLSLPYDLKSNGR